MDFNIKEAAALFLQRLWREHPGKFACSLAGVLLGIIILLFGFWRVFFCGAAGNGGAFYRHEC